MSEAGDDRFDDLDAEILDQIAAVHAILDPPPSTLDERVRFTLALQRLDVEVARLQPEALLGSGARAAERTRTITFDAQSLTIMLSVAELPDGLVRLDGWLAPAAALRVELRLAAPAEHRETLSDETGRFVFDRVGRGLAQLLVHRDGAAGGGAGRSVVTPSLIL